MNFIRQAVNKIKNNIKSKISKTLGIKTVGEYKAELEKFLDDIQLLGESDIIDELIAELGIAGTAKEYQNLNYVFKNYYRFIIREISKATNTSPELKKLAKRVEEEWEATLKGVISYLHKKKQSLMYGESLEPDYFSDVKTYSANSFSDQPLPWLRKEDINEDYFEEGLFGAASGAISGAALALVVSSLSNAFKMKPSVLTGIAAGLGAIIGHFVQKHYFIDFTNYVKLKRYIEYEPESYELIIEMMQKNATKFKQKDPVKYKKILQNLKRIQNNPPPDYRNYLDDEIESEYDDDPNMFDVYDKEGNLVKSGTSEISFGSGSRSSFGSSRRRSSRRLGLQRDYNVKDLGSSVDDLEAELDYISRM